MPIIYGIDGTGARKDNVYAQHFQDSFVKKLCNNGANYSRGPAMEGSGLLGAISTGVDYITAQAATNPGSPILLTGFSRGAAGAVVIAKRLKKQGLNVQALLLFDCVDRHLFIDSSKIPSNVGEVLHIRRNKAARSRESFGNSGTKYSEPTIYTEKYYTGTHGAMGGTFWTPDKGQKESDLINEGFPDGKTAVTFAQDRAASTMIWTDIQPFLRQHGFVGY